MKSWCIKLFVLAACLHVGATLAYSAEDWPQYKYDCRRSGNVPARSVNTPLGLVGAVPLTDAVFTAPAVADGRIYVVDGSGVAFCIDAGTLEIEWKFQSGGDEANCNNVCSPAVAEGYIHFGTMAGSYYVLDGTIYYSCYFGHSAKDRRGLPSAKGLTAAIDPQTGQVIWLTTKYFIHGGCTISAADGRLYLGGYNKLEGGRSLVWCVDARDGSMVWKSEPVREAIQVVTIGPRFLFVHAQYRNGYLLDKDTGRILTTLSNGYKCTRFTFSDPYLLGSNMDVHDLSDPENVRLISTGPRLDPSECIGAVASNGRLFYTGHGGGLQACQICRTETASGISSR